MLFNLVLRLGRPDRVQRNVGSDPVSRTAFTLKLSQQSWPLETGAGESIRAEGGASLLDAVLPNSFTWEMQWASTGETVDLVLAGGFQSMHPDERFGD